MPRKQKKYHFIYRTTNLINSKFYVGMHSTDDLEDGYVGSGKRLGYSIRKHGLDNHKVEILEFLTSREELKKREAEIVSEELLTNPLCMNLKFGGEGGWDHLNNDPAEREKIQAARSSAGNKALHFKKQNDPEFAERYRKALGNSNTKRKGREPKASFAGRIHSEETKKKMRKPKNIGKLNSQFGTCWVCIDGEAKKIKKEDLQSWLDLGWRKGRK